MNKCEQDNSLSGKVLDNSLNEYLGFMEDNENTQWFWGSKIVK